MATTGNPDGGQPAPRQPYKVTTTKTHQLMNYDQNWVTLMALFLINCFLKTKNKSQIKYVRFHKSSRQQHNIVTLSTADQQKFPL